MDDEILVFIRDRFDGIERRLDQQRGALELWASSINELSIQIAKQNAKQNGRIHKIEAWIANRKHNAERSEDLMHQRLGRWASVVSALLGGSVVFILSLLIGAH